MTDTPQPNRAEEIRTATVQIQLLIAKQQEFVAAVRQCHSTIVFATHPDITGLDDELDNLYPDA